MEITSTLYLFQWKAVLLTKMIHLVKILPCYDVFEFLDHVANFD